MWNGIAWADMICGSLVLLMALWGAWKGFVRQLFSLAAVVVVILFALPAAAKITEFVAEGRDWGPGTLRGVRIGAIVVAVIGINLGVNLLGRWVDRIIGRKRFEEGAKMATWNRWWGAALGMIKAGLACWLVLCFFVAFPKTLPAVNRHFDETRPWAVRTTALFNPFTYWFDDEAREDFGATLKELWELRDQPDKWDRVMANDEVGKVVDNERVKEIEKGGGETSLIDLLKDEEFRESLQGIDWKQVRHAVEEAKAKGPPPEAK
jgi:hypothetical protein